MERFIKTISLTSPYTLSVFAVALIAHGVDAQATQSTYTSLAPLPGTENVVTSGSGSFAQYINALYNAALIVAGILAVVMITLGGIEYMASDTPFSKADGKAKIYNAIIGLLLLLSSYLILNTINKQLLNLDINIPNATSQANDVGSGAGGGEGASTYTSGVTGGDATLNLYSGQTAPSTLQAGGTTNSSAQSLDNPNGDSSYLPATPTSNIPSQ